jgi:hypothetical protein
MVKAGRRTKAVDEERYGPSCRVSVDGIEEEFAVDFNGRHFYIVLRHNTQRDNAQLIGAE